MKKSGKRITILNHNDFFTKLPTQQFDLFSEESRRDLAIGDQIQILISCEENSEMRAALLEYWQSSQSNPEFDADEFIESLIQ